MLEEFFARYEYMGFRHRFFQDEADLRYCCETTASLNGRKIILIAAHGTKEGLEPEIGIFSTDEIADALSRVPDLQMVHFSSCDIMKGNVEAVQFEILNSLGMNSFLIFRRYCLF